MAEEVTNIDVSAMAELSLLHDEVRRKLHMKIKDASQV